MSKKSKNIHNVQLELPLGSKPVSASNHEKIFPAVQTGLPAIDFVKALNDKSLLESIARKKQLEWARKVLKNSEGEDLLEM